MYEYLRKSKVSHSSLLVGLLTWVLLGLQPHCEAFADTLDPGVFNDTTSSDQHGHDHDHHSGTPDTGQDSCFDMPFSSSMFVLLLDANSFAGDDNNQEKITTGRFNVHFYKPVIHKVNSFLLGKMSRSIRPLYLVTQRFLI